MASYSFTSPKVDNVQFIAHDVGVAVLEELVARDQEGMLPFRIKSVALLNGTLFASEYQERPIQRLLASPIGGLINRLASKRTLSSNLRQISRATPGLTDEELATYWDLLNYPGNARITHRLTALPRPRGAVASLRGRAAPAGRAGSGHLLRHRVLGARLAPGDCVAFSAAAGSRTHCLSFLWAGAILHARMEPQVMWHYTRRVLAGQKLQSIQGDPHQLGGNFVIDAAGVLRLAHRSKDPVDRPPVKTLLAALT